MTHSHIAPAMKAQYYALRQKGCSKQKAVELISNHSFEDVDKLTHAGQDIITAKKIFEKVFLNRGEILNSEFYSKQQNPDFYLSLGDSIVFQFESEEELCVSLAKTINTICKTCFDKEDITKQVFIKSTLLIAPIMESCGYKLGLEQESEEFKFSLSNSMALAYSTTQLSDEFIK